MDQRYSVRDLKERTNENVKLRRRERRTSRSRYLFIDSKRKWTLRTKRKTKGERKQDEKF